MSRSDIINNFLDAMSLIANKAAEDVNQDKTVIMQVKAAEENSYTLTYNSVDYSTIVSEEKYAVGDYVYVTCIGGIDGSEKVILHKVPNQTGLSTTIQKPEYVVQGIPFISINDINCGDTVTAPAIDCNSLAAYLKVHKLLRIKAKVTTNFDSNFYLDEDGTNFTKNFGLKFVFNLVDGTTKSVSLDTNSMSGFPYDLNNEWQEAIIEFEEAEALKISSLNSIECFIEGYSLTNDESITFEEITLSVVKLKGAIGSLSAQVVNLSNDLKIDTTSGVNDEVKLQVVFSSPEALNFTPGYRWYIINQDNVDDWEDSPFNSTSGVVLSQSNLLSNYNNIKCIWGKVIDGAVEKIGETNFEIENITGLSVVGSREIQDSQFNLSVKVLSSNGSLVTEGITYKWKETDYLGETRELSSSATLTIDPYTNVTVRSEYTGFAYKDSTCLGSTDTYVIYQAVKSGSTISNIYNLYTVTATNSPPDSPKFSAEGVVLDPWYSSIPGNYGEDYKYLWSCAAMKMSDGTIIATTPELSFVYGEGGAEGAAGRSVVDFHWYYNTNRDAGSWEGDRITVDGNDNLVEADWTKEKPSDSSLEEGECLWETQVIEYDKRGGKADSKYQIGAPSLKTYLKLEESGVSLTTNGDYFIYKEDKTISPSVIIIEKNVYGRAREVKNWSWEYGVEGASGVTWQSVPNYSNNAAICKSQDGDDVYVRQNAMANRDTVFIKVTGSLGEDENKVEYTDGCNLIRVPAGKSTVNYVWSNPVMTFSADEDGKVPANQQEVANLTVLEGATNITNKITGFNFISAGSDNPPNVTISTSGAQATMQVGDTANNFGAAGTLKGTLNFEFTYEGKTYNPSLKWIKNAKGDDAISIAIPNSSFTFDDSATGETHTAQVLVTKGGAALSYAASQATSGDGWYYMVSSTSSYVTKISASGVKISKPSATSDIPVTIKVYQGTSLKIEKTLNVSCTVFKPAYSMDLNNDTDTVPADKEGTVPDGGLSGAKSSMTVLYGTVQQNLSTTNCSVTVPTGLTLNTHYTFSIVNNVATFSLISYPASFADSLSIVFNYKINDTETISKTFTITKIRSEDPVDYYLELAPNAINTTSSGGTVQVRVKQRKGEIISNVTGTIGTVTPSTGNAFSSTSGSSSDPYYAYSYSQNQVGEVIFTLKIDNVEWEKETLLMTKNGDKGDTGDKGDKGDKGDTGDTGATVEAVYAYYVSDSSTAPPRPQSAPSTGTGVKSWKDTPQVTDSKNRWQYISQTIKTDDEIDNSKWTTPVLWSIYALNGTSVTVASGYPKYCVTKSADSTPGTDADWKSDQSTAISGQTLPYYVWTWIKYSDNTNSKVATYSAKDGDKGDTITSEQVWLYYGSSTMEQNFTEPFAITDLTTQLKPDTNANWSFTVPNNTYVYKRWATRTTTTSTGATTYAWKGPWSAVELHSFQNNANSSYLENVRIFDALTVGGSKQGLYYGDTRGNPVSPENFNPKDHLLYINANYIQVGEITSKNINTKDLQAEKILVQNGDNILFYAEGTEKNKQVLIAGFEIIDGVLSSTNNGNTVSIGTEAMLLGNKAQLDSIAAPSGTSGKGFKVTKEGFLYSDIAKIGGWDITSNAISTGGITLSSASSDGPAIRIQALANETKTANYDESKWAAYSDSVRVSNTEFKVRITLNREVANIHSVELTDYGDLIIYSNKYELCQNSTTGLWNQLDVYFSFQEWDDDGWIDIPDEDQMYQIDVFYEYIYETSTKIPSFTVYDNGETRISYGQLGQNIQAGFLYLNKHQTIAGESGRFTKASSYFQAGTNESLCLNSMNVGISNNDFYFGRGGLIFRNPNFSPTTNPNIARGIRLTSSGLSIDGSNNAFCSVTGSTMTFSQVQTQYTWENVDEHEGLSYLFDANNKRIRNIGNITAEPRTSSRSQSRLWIRGMETLECYASNSCSIRAGGSNKLFIDGDNDNINLQANNDMQVYAKHDIQIYADGGLYLGKTDYIGQYQQLRGRWSADNLFGTINGWTTDTINNINGFTSVCYVTNVGNRRFSLRPTTKTNIPFITVTSGNQEIGGSGMLYYVDYNGNVRYSSASSISSDRNAKNTIQPFTQEYDLIFNSLNPVMFKYNQGTVGRMHLGFIAQEVESAVEKTGLTTKDFAAVCYDINLDTGEKYNYALRYEEFIALNTWQIQKLKERVAALETELSLLKNS